MTALTLRGVSARYGARVVAADVTVSVEAGGWLAIIGPNGAGKSSLLKAIVGIVSHDGDDPAGRRAGVDAVQPGAGAGGRVRAADPAAAGPPDGDGLRAARPDPAPVAAGAGAAVGPGGGVEGADPPRPRRDLATRALQTLSGGERQRAVLARVLAQQAGLLLLDEPTTGLDIGHAQALLDLIDRLRHEEGATVVSTLHDLTLSAQYASQLLLLDKGKVVATRHTGRGADPRDHRTPLRRQGRGPAHRGRPLVVAPARCNNSP